MVQEQQWQILLTKNSINILVFNYVIASAFLE